ncbi:MAG: putative DNA-binding domain-containing protein, partial [Pseudomonadota bacterium]
MADALLAPDRPVPAAVRTARRFAVYRNNVVVGLIDALAATYP